MDNKEVYTIAYVPRGGCYKRQMHQVESKREVLDFSQDDEVKQVFHIVGVNEKGQTNSYIIALVNGKLDLQGRLVPNETVCKSSDLI